MTTIAVAGAGIAGLSAALALAAAGVDVHLLDAQEQLSEAGAGIQLSPNATRVLRGLGLLEAIDPMAVRPEQVRIRRARDGATLTTVPLGALAERRYGAPFLVIHRADLQAALLAAAMRHPRVTLELGTRVALAASTGEGVTLALSRGKEQRVRQVDGLVGADGLHSSLRQAMASDAADRLRFSGRTAWRSLVPAAAAPDFARERASGLWLGHRAHLVHYPVRGGALVNVVAIVEAPDLAGADRTAWSRAGDAGQLRAAFAGWSEQARQLLDAAPGWRVWSLFDRAPLPRWSNGPVVLVGDAAHPMLPFLAQGAAQAVEDAAALARAVRAGPTIAAAALAYERARRPRAERAQRDSRRQSAIYHLAAPAANLRDAAFRLLGPSRMLARFDWLYAG